MRVTSAPIRGGWLLTCLECRRQVAARDVAAVVAFKAGHTCAPSARAATTTRHARTLLAILTPDPIDDVLARRDALLAADADYRLTRRASA